MSAELTAQTRLAYVMLKLCMLLKAHPELSADVQRLAVKVIAFPDYTTLREIFEEVKGESASLPMRTGKEFVGIPLPLALECIPLLTPVGAFDIPTASLAPEALRKYPHSLSCVLDVLMSGDPEKGTLGLEELLPQLPSLVNAMEDMALDNQLLRAEVEGRSKGWDGNNGSVNNS